MSFRIPRSLRPLIATGAIVAALAAVLPDAPVALCALPQRGTEAPTPELPVSGLLRLVGACVARRPQVRRAVRRVQAMPAVAGARASGVTRAMVGMARRMAPAGDVAPGTARHDAVTA